MITDNPRKYGNQPYSVVLVHGGPGAPGEMASVARELSKRFGVLEPLQTKNSVSGQVEELKQQIIKNATTPVVLVGWSWGAWLSFIVAAENPVLVKKLILISSGPFEAEYAKSIMPTRLDRLTREEGEKVKELIDTFQKGIIDNKLFQEFGELMRKADSFDPIQERGGATESQPDIYESVWKEAEELRRSGKLLEHGKSIDSPVVVIHGDYDPHPFEGIKEPLSRTIKDCKFILLENCGHHPWLEKQAKDKFYEILTKELWSGKGPGFVKIKTTITGRIYTKIFALLEEHPEGLRWSELLSKIKEYYPSFHPKTINGCVWKLIEKYPKDVYKPSKGLFCLLKFKVI